MCHVTLGAHFLYMSDIYTINDVCTWAVVDTQMSQFNEYHMRTRNELYTINYKAASYYI